MLNFRDLTRTGVFIVVWRYPLETANLEALLEISENFSRLPKSNLDNQPRTPNLALALNNNQVPPD